MKKGESPSQATRQKMRLAKLGKKLSPAHREKVRLASLGNKSNTGRKLSPEHKRKISKAMSGRTLSKEHRLKLSELRKGAKSKWWKGGITSLNLKIRKSVEYKVWRDAVFKRDKYLCVIGGKAHGNRLNADHIKSFSQYPSLRLVVANGRTLCIKCHESTENFGGASKKRVEN